MSNGTLSCVDWQKDTDILPSCSESDIPNSGLSSLEDEGTRILETFKLTANH